LSQIDPLRAGLEQALGAQYEIIRLLGRGGMGAVYLAQERALERAVAIKVLPPEIATSAEAQERFRREARTAAKLTHPNIVPLHTFGEVEGMMYFVMGYVRGESLADRIRREETIPSDEVRRILGDMADALDYAHRQGVIHRDIKPDNILLEEESGRPMLTDFGIAKASASGETLTELGTAIGTPQYMSPEQASGEREIDGRSDLYSLGIVGYAMLSGRAPFDGTSAQEILVQHVTKAPPALGTVASNAPADLAKAITRCLAKAPDARWPDGASLREAVADTGQAEEAVLEKRAWFDGVFMGQLAPTGYFLALLLIFLGSIVTGSFSISTTSVEEAGAIGGGNPLGGGGGTLSRTATRQQALGGRACQ
jgi:serine/threonine-protein kinase